MTEKLDIIIDSKGAVNSLERLNNEFKELRNSLQNLKVNKSLVTKLDSLSKIRPIDKSVVRNMNDLSKSVNHLSKAGSIQKYVNSIEKLSKVDASRTAQHITQLVKALNNIKVPQSLLKIAPLLNQIAKDSKKAQSGVKALSNSVNQVNGAGKFQKLTNSVQKFDQSVRKAAGSVNFFGRAMGTASGLLAGFGVALGSVGLANFITKSKEAVFTMDRFKVLMKALEPAGADAGKALDFVNRIADSTATSVSVLADSYGKFSASALNTGFTVNETNSVFSNMAEVFRTLNLSAGDARLAMLALEQMVSKNKISSEELRRQLGERIPGAVKIFADSVGVSTAALEKMLRAGEFDGRTVIKFAKEMAKRFRLTGEALKTPQAQLQLLSNAFFRLQESFGRGLFEKLLPGLKEFTQAVSDGNLKAVFKDMGETLGQFASDTLSMIARNGPAIAEFLKNLISGVQSAAAFIRDNFDTIKKAILAVIALQVVSWVTTVVASLASLAAGAVALGKALAVGTVALVAFMGPIGAIVAAFAAAAAGGYAVGKALGFFTDSTNKVAEANKTTETTHKKLSEAVRQQASAYQQAAQKEQEIARAQEAASSHAENQVRLAERRIIQHALQRRAILEEIDALKASGQAESDRAKQLQSSADKHATQIELIREKVSVLQLEAAQQNASTQAQKDFQKVMDLNAQAIKNGTANSAEHLAKIRAITEGYGSLKDGTGKTTTEMERAGGVYDVTANATDRLKTAQNSLAQTTSETASKTQEASSNIQAFAQETATASNAIADNSVNTSKAMEDIRSSTALAAVEAQNLSAAFTTVDTSTASLKENLLQVSTNTESLKQHNTELNEAYSDQENIVKTLSPVQEDLALRMKKSATASGELGIALTSISGIAQDLVSSLTQMSSQLDKTNTSITNIVSNINQWFTTTEKLYQAVERLNGTISELISMAPRAVHQIETVSQRFINSSRAADQAASAYRRATDALERYHAERSSGDGRGSSREVSAQRVGGYAGSSVKTQVVSNSAFRNAPHLANGIANTSAFTSTVPGGGIPSILHPNEAVIPLSGNRSVPVQLSGGVPAPMSNPLAGEQLNMLILIRDEVSYLRENAKQHVTLLIDRLRNIELGIENLIFEIKAIPTEIKNMTLALEQALKNVSATPSVRNTSNTGSSGSSGTGSYGGSYSGGIEWQYHATRKANRSLSVSRQVDGEWLSQFDLETQRAILNEAQRQLGTADLGRSVDDRSRRAGIGFATGSPNAFIDATGGFQATLHPDEAVIPLPDGRSVPVDLGSSEITGMFDNMTAKFDRFTDTQEATNERFTQLEVPAPTVVVQKEEMKDRPSDTPAPVINVHMNVNTPDADSFRRSEKQMTQELAEKIGKAHQQIGEKRTYDDPTRRV